MSASREVEIIRCICSRRVVLAYVKFDRLNRPYVHIKIYKQKQIFGEVIFSFGKMRVRCRECLRWHEILIRHEKPEVKEISIGD